MKKICLSLMIFGLVAIFAQFQVRATTEDGYPIGKNYLDLHNLIMKSDVPDYAYTKDPIQVKSNQMYTIVVDFAFLGQHSDWLGDIYISIEEIPSHDVQSFLLLGDMALERAYVEFVPQDNYVHIMDLPMMPTGYNAIMYEGSYNDFTGFEPYLDMDEQMTFQGVLPVDYDDPMTLESIESYIHAKDPYGNSLSLTVGTDEYSSGTKMPGSYTMTFMATFNQITKAYQLEVRVFDQSPPVIHNPGTLMIPLSDKTPVQNIIDTLTVTDNVDTLFPSDLELVSDTYTAKNTVGSSSITVSVSDSSGNTSSLQIPINLVDQNGPTITGPDTLYIYTTDVPMTHSDILSYYTIIDDVDGTNVSIEFSTDEYLETLNPGIYAMTIKAYDTQANDRIKNIYVHVIENRGPSFSTDALILSVDAANAMTDDQIIDWFNEQTLSAGSNITNVSILYNEYDKHTSETGQYYVYLNYEEEGQTMVSRILVEVQAEEQPFSFMPYLEIGGIGILGLAIFFILRRKK